MLIITFIINGISYLAIRYIIWSIVKIDISKKKNKLIEFRRECQREGFFKRLEMSYLQKYVVTCTDEFQFWIKVKNIFVLSEFGIMTISFFLSLAGYKVYWFPNFMLVQAIIIHIIVIIQFRHGKTGRETKYEDIKHRNK